MVKNSLKEDGNEKRRRRKGSVETLVAHYTYLE